VTLIPLNKIRAFKISAEVRTVPLQATDDHVPNPTLDDLQKLQNARHLAPGKVRPALTLVSYPDEVAEAIAFVFNDTLICDDAASAQAVTFARNVGVRSVTLDGDVYEPSGTMSGGAAPSGSGVLVRAQELRAAEERVANARKTLETLEREEAKGRSAREAWRARTRKVEIEEHELRLLQEQVGTSNAARVRRSSSHCSLVLPLMKGPPPCFRSARK
jgi:structural maintenance of chromosome 2